MYACMRLRVLKGFLYTRIQVLGVSTGSSDNAATMLSRARGLP